MSLVATLSPLSLIHTHTPTYPASTTRAVTAQDAHLTRRLAQGSASASDQPDTPLAGSHPFAWPLPADANMNLDEEVRLYTTNTERERTENLATLYSIIVSLEYLERAYVRDSVTGKEWVISLRSQGLLDWLSLGSTSVPARGSGCGSAMEADNRTARDEGTARELECVDLEWMGGR